MAAMDLVLRPATEADRNIAHRLLTAQLIEHRLPADPDGVAHGIDLALAPHSPAWLWLGQREGRTVAIFLANEVVSVERGGLVLWVEELYVVPETRRSGIARALLARVCQHARRRGVRAIEARGRACTGGSSRLVSRARIRASASNAAVALAMTSPAPPSRDVRSMATRGLLILSRGATVPAYGPPMVRGRESESTPLFQPAVQRSRRRPGTGRRRRALRLAVRRRGRRAAHGGGLAVPSG